MSQLNGRYSRISSSTSLNVGGLSWDLFFIPAPGKDYVLVSYPESSWACLIGSYGDDALELNLFLKEEEKFAHDVTGLIRSKEQFLDVLYHLIGTKYKVAVVAERNLATSALFGRWTAVNTKRWQDVISAYFVC